ncbi:hypothetical protein FF38_04223 [Lucilia cuprina]|uniref:Uncharacterized protein n=1 Tax=Lucilia cuprina TaxID=7375 RepID=A0A0L0BLH0_LUCCU|nr:hypothetical protein FF38_04223 [Lucilia cuprina]
MFKIHYGEGITVDIQLAPMGAWCGSKEKLRVKDGIMVKVNNANGRQKMVIMELKVRKYTAELYPCFHINMSWSLVGFRKLLPRHFLNLDLSKSSRSFATTGEMVNQMGKAYIFNERFEGDLRIIEAEREMFSLWYDLAMTFF